MHTQVPRQHSALLAVGLSSWLIACGGIESPPTSQEQALRSAPDPKNTITIHVHGWNLSGSSKTGTVGDDRGGGSTVDGIRRFTGMPHGSTSPTATDQIIGTEYYGKILPSYYSAADIAEVDALSGVPRYAAIVGKYARYVMQRSGAEGVNLTCHSMGCLISHYIIENDVEKLASEGKIRRWVSFAGVVGGAKLADLDRGKWLDPLAKLLGYDLIDVEHMSYDWVTDKVTIYDHKRRDGNNPYFGNILVHHILATNPKIDTALSIPLLDLLGSANVPNDGIVLDDEMYLHEQQPSARWTTPSGTQLPTSQSHHFANHFNITEQVSAQALASAALTGSRRVQVQLSKITLRNDKEDPFLGKPPAEVVVESTVKYAYVNAIDASEPTLDEVSMARRNAPVLSMNKGETKTPNLMIFDGPAFDGQTSVSLNVKLSETDFYPAGGVNENLLSAPAPLGAFSGDVPLAPGDYTVTTADAVFTLHVSIEKLY